MGIKNPSYMFWFYFPEYSFIDFFPNKNSYGDLFKNRYTSKSRFSKVLSLIIICKKESVNFLNYKLFVCFIDLLCLLTINPCFRSPPSHLVRTCSGHPRDSAKRTVGSE